MNGYLLDSTVITDWLRGHPSTVRWLSARAAAGARLILSPVTVVEVMAGTAPGLRARRREQRIAVSTAPASARRRIGARFILRAALVPRVVRARHRVCSSALTSTMYRVAIAPSQVRAVLSSDRPRLWKEMTP